MPRADSKASASEAYDSLSSSNPSTMNQSSAGLPAQKKKHVCPTCDRAFTTSGHLARHSRVHTGEKNHKCPFPGCETRCSRQDNLQQHYRIHLSPGSRRTSSRSTSRSSRVAGSRRGVNSGLAPPGSSNMSYPAPDSPPALTSSLANLAIPPPPLSPPPLEPAHPNGRMVYMQHSTPPDSPPALTPATIPATAIQQHPQSQFMISRSSNSASPDGMYSGSSFSSGSAMNMTMNGQSSHSPTVPAPNYSYRGGTSTYQEQATGASGGYTYVHTTPVSTSNSPNYTSNPASNPHSLPHINTLNSYNSSLSRSGSPSLSAASHTSSASVSASASPLSSVSSRHSISHISHAQSYPPLQSQNISPSPVSAHSNSPHGQMLPSVSALSSSLSNPPTPTTYSGVYSDHSSTENLSHPHQFDNGIINPPPSSTSSPHSLPTASANYSPALSVQSNGSAGSMSTLTQPLSQHASGPGILGPSLSRYDSPPPVLAPIQGYATHGGNSHETQPRMIEERYGHGQQGPGTVHQRSYSDRYDAHSNGYGRGGYGSRYSDESDGTGYLGQHAHSPTIASNAYGGYGTIGGVSLGHGAWKAESGLGRSMKGIGALVQ